MKNSSPRIDAYLQKATKWKDVQAALRSILLSHPLQEEMKWGKPCYTFDGGNVAIIQPFKESCALMFFKGSLLPDPASQLEKPGENSHIAKRIRFSSISEVLEAEPHLNVIINEAVEIEKTGREIPAKNQADLVLVQELQDQLDSDSELRAAFEALTLWRQRSYNLHISGAKQASTRISRIEKCRDRIMEGKGFNER